VHGCPYYRHRARGCPVRRPVHGPTFAVSLAVLDANTIISAILVGLGISRRILRSAFEWRSPACAAS
jgi:hypothetical protein